MYFEHVRTSELFVYESTTKAREDENKLDRIRNWVFLSAIPILFALIYFDSSRDYSRYGNGYTDSACVLIGIDRIFDFCRKHVSRIAAEKMKQELTSYQNLSPHFPTVGVQLNENSVSVSSSNETKTYQWKDLKRVVFAEEIILFIAKKDDAIFSITLEDTREIYRFLKKKVHTTVFAMKSLKETSPHEQPGAGI